MKKQWIAGLVTAGIIVSAVGVTALAGGFQKPTVTCPECGAEFELEQPENGGRGMGRGPMSAEDFQAQLEEKVASGELTQEEADEQLAEFEARQAEMEQEREEMQAAREAELEERVASGELTQEEADEILNSEPGGRGPGGPGRMPPDAPGGEAPVPPDGEDTASSEA